MRFSASHQVGKQQVVSHTHCYVTILYICLPSNLRKKYKNTKRAIYLMVRAFIEHLLTAEHCTTCWVSGWASRLPPSSHLGRHFLSLRCESQSESRREGIGAHCPRSQPGPLKQGCLPTGLAFSTLKYSTDSLLALVPVHGATAWEFLQNSSLTKGKRRHFINIPFQDTLTGSASLRHTVGPFNQSTPR